MPWGLLLLLAVGLALVVVLLTALLIAGSFRPPRHDAVYAGARGVPTHPADVGLSAGEWWRDRPDGVRLPVWDINIRSGEKKPGDLTVLFVHGWGMSLSDMLLRLEPWPDLAGRIILYDLRGHG